jgi:minor extracellular serine protease Vpr
MRRFFVCFIAFIVGPGSIASLRSLAPPRQADSAIGTINVIAVASTAVPVSAIVELESEPVVEHQASASPVLRQRIELESDSARAYESQIRSEHEQFKSRAALVSPNLRVRTELTVLLNAVSIEAPGTEVAAIAALPQVRRVRLTKEYHATLDKSVPLLGAMIAWNSLGGPTFAGQGMKIAILDSGIDITNPLFSDVGFAAPTGFPRGNTAFTNNKVIVAKAFFSDPNMTPADENGHGTNVAGIAAGSFTVSPLGTISGVAPRAYLGNYRVLNKEGQGRDDFIIRGLEEVVRDGFDVANLSLGASASTELDPLDQAVEAAVRAGVTVTVSAGNSGSNGQMTIASPGVAPSAITVAATTNSHSIGPSVNVTSPTPVSPVLLNIESTQGSNGSASLSDSIGPLPYVDAETLGGNSRACSPFPSGSLASKIALIERGDCTFTDKINAADQAGAKAVVVFNKDLSEGSDGGDNLITMNVQGTNIPSVFIARSKGLALRDWLKAHPDAQLRIDPIAEFDFPADVLAPFSSRGPSSIGGLKPDVAAPGVNIYSGAIKQSSGSNSVSDPSGFLAVSGTSQAAPHVAGAAALLKQLHPSWTPAQIKSALVSSATTSVFSNIDKTDKVGVLDSGGGRIDLSRAIRVSATFSPASLSFGLVKLKGADVATANSLSITNESEGQNTFTISIQQLTTGPGFSINPATTTVTLARGQSTQININITATAGVTPRNTDFTGYVNVTDQTGQTLRVPYWIRFVKKRSTA